MGEGIYISEAPNSSSSMTESNSLLWSVLMNGRWEDISVGMVALVISFKPVSLVYAVGLIKFAGYWWLVVLKYSWFSSKSWIQSLSS